MIDDTTTIERNPVKLLHPLLMNELNLQHAKNALKQFDIDNPSLPPSPALSKEAIESVPEHSWLKKCTTTLVEIQDEGEDATLDNLYNDLIATADEVGEEVCLKEHKRLIALDLETTGLNKTIQRVGGKNISYNHIVGVCVASETNKGYYIPVRHNEKDEVKNFSQASVIKFLQRLLDENHIVYHNAVFDMEVLSQSGVFIYPRKQTFSDTMIIAINNGYREVYRQVGLKFLSNEFLHRNMVEIKELMGGKNEIRLWSLPAKNAYVYGCSDAMNTLALFHYMLKDKNPYKRQRNSILLDHRTVHSVRNLYRHGLPIHYAKTLSAIKTMIRRSVMLENIFYEMVSNKDISVSSPEQIGTHIFSLLKKEFELQLLNGERELNHKEKGFDILCKKLLADFEMEVKVKELKSGEIRIVANSSDAVLTSLYKNLEAKWSFVSKATADEIYTICEILNHYRSLLHEIPIFHRLLRFVYNDDLNLSRGGIGLKLLGATTGRFSNQSSKSGANDHILISENTRGAKIEFKQGDGILGINSQGLSNSSGTYKKVRRVLNFNELDEEMTREKQKLDNITDACLRELMETGKL